MQSAGRFLSDGINTRDRGFWGICAIWLTAMIIGIGLGANAIVSVVICLSALAILYGVLHLGDESKAWPQLV